MSLHDPSTRRPPWLSVLLPALALAACSPKTSAPKTGGKPGAIPVVVIKAAKKDVPLILPSIGSVQPRATVTVRPQVGGQLSEVHFREGDFVRKGDLLFTIDSRPFDVALAQANAALDQAKAEASNAAAQEQRYVKLDRGGSVSAELVEQVRTASVTALTKVTAAEAQVRQAKLELEYCRITAPLGGRAGRLLLDPGNIVQANLTDLTVINEIQPIEVSFNLAGRHLDALRQFSAADALGGGGLEVTVVPEGATGSGEKGTVSFFDNTVRSATGTIEVRAVFPNEKQTLWPGQFTDVRLRLTESRGAITVPAKAIQTGQKGQFVYVIGNEGTAESRLVSIERMFESEALIREGVKEGEAVVVEGQNLLSPNAKVEIQAHSDKAPPPAGKGSPTAPPAAAGAASKASAPAQS